MSDSVKITTTTKKFKIKEYKLTVALIINSAITKEINPYIMH